MDRSSVITLTATHMLTHKAAWQIGANAKEKDWSDWLKRLCKVRENQNSKWSHIIIFE